MDSSELLEELLNLPEVKYARRSPNGKYIAIKIAGIHSNHDIFLLDLTNPTHLTALTNNNETTILYDWWPDSESIIIAQDHERDERLTVFRVFVNEPDVLHPLTEIYPSFYISDVALSPDGQKLYLFANYDPENEIETENFHILVKNLESDTTYLLTSALSPASTHYLELNSQGTKLLYNRSDLHPAGEQIWVINSDGSDDHELLNFGKDTKVIANWHPDGDHVIFITESFAHRHLEKRLVGMINIYTKIITWITNPMDPDRNDFFKAEVSPYSSNFMQLETRRGGKTVAYFFDFKLKTLFPLNGLPGTLIPYQKLNDDAWIALYYSSIQPYTLVQFSESNMRHLHEADLKFYIDTYEYSLLNATDLVQAQSVYWSADDSLTIHGWLYQSPQETDRAIIFVHGGPTYHITDEMLAEIQFYVHQGFHVLVPNFRGSTGYGLMFRELIKEEGWGGIEQWDILNGAKMLIESGKVGIGYDNIPKLGITGTSFGGFAAWFAIAKFPEIYKAAAPICGMTDLEVDYNTTRSDLKTYSAEMMRGTPKENPDSYFVGSPINYIQNIRGKVLMIQGLHDPNVTPANLEIMEQKLHEHSIIYEKITFDDEGHGVRRKRNIHTKILCIAEFFKRELV